MKKVRDVIGIDVSKKTIDATLYHSRQHAVFSNDEEGYEELIRWSKRHLETSEYFFCFENTGNYSLKLSVFLSSLSLIYVEESPMRIKRSIGLAREKTDKLDSYMIARFGWMYREELEPSNVKPKEFQEIGRLLALRDQMVRNRLRYCIWHHWKKPERKRKNLIRLGVEQGKAYAWSRTRMGGWAVAQSPILRTTITIERLKRRGYISLVEYLK